MYMYVPFSTVMIPNGYSKPYEHYLLLPSADCTVADVHYSRHPNDGVWSRRPSQRGQERGMFVASSPATANTGMYGANRCHDSY